jgi:hypothetical protein
MRQCFVNLLQALEAICLVRSRLLITLPHWPQSVEEFCRQIAKELDPHEAMLLSHLLPQHVCFEKLGFTMLEEVRAAAVLREMVEQVLTTVRIRADLTIEDPLHLHAYDHAHDLLSALSRRRLLHFMVQFRAWRDVSRYEQLHSFLQNGMDWLVPLAVAACMLCVDDPEGYEGDELPDAAAAAKVEMWLRDTVMSSQYLSSSADMWESEDAAQMERDRRALVDAVQLLHSAADGTAAAELVRVREQLVTMQADMQQRSHEMLQHIDRLTQYVNALQRRLNAAPARP